MPTYFDESVEHSSSPELRSDELITALAAGRWWAIMEVSDPISEEHAYYPNSWQWCGTVEEAETSCPSSPVFSDASEKTPRSGLSDATKSLSKRQQLKIPEPLRQKLLEQKPYVCSLQEAPVPNNIPEKKRLNIPEPMRQPLASSRKGAHLCCTQDAQGVPDKIPEMKTLTIPVLLKKEQLQQNPQASSLQIAPMSTKSPLDAPLPNSCPMGAPVHVRTPQEAAVPAESAALPARKILRARQRLAENLRENLQNAPVSVSFTQGAPMRSRIAKAVSEHSGTPDVPQIPADPKESIGQSRQKLNIPEPLVHVRTPQEAEMPAWSSQAAALAESAALHAQKILRARRRHAENLRENLQN